MGRFVLVAWIALPILGCDTGPGEPRGGASRAESVSENAGTGVSPVPSPTLAGPWVLWVREETEVSYVGASEGFAAYELDVPERGEFTTRAVLRLRSFPRRQGECTILETTGYEETPLVLHGVRDGDRIRLRESRAARRTVLTMECDELIVTTPTEVAASEHEFELRLAEGETHEHRPAGERKGQRTVVHYTLRTRAFVEARRAARPIARPPVQVCTPNAAAHEAIREAIRRKDHRAAIDLAIAALGLGRLGLPLTIDFDPALSDPDSPGATREDPEGRIAVRLGPAAFHDSPDLLGVILHEAVGHGALGRSEHDPELPGRWGQEEREALRIELLAAGVLGTGDERLARIDAAYALRGGGTAAGSAESGPPSVTWITCEED